MRVCLNAYGKKTACKIVSEKFKVSESQVIKAIGEVENDSIIEYYLKLGKEIGESGVDRLLKGKKDLLEVIFEKYRADLMSVPDCIGNAIDSAVAGLRDK